MRGKKFKILNLLILIIVVVNLVWVFAEGQSMTAHTMKILADDCKVKDVKIKMSNEGVIDFLGYHIDPDDNEFLIDVRSIGKGDTRLKLIATIEYPNGNVLKLKVLFFNVTLSTVTSVYDISGTAQHLSKFKLLALVSLGLSFIY